MCGSPRRSGPAKTQAYERADLLLVGFRPAERVIRFNIVEVKFREDLAQVARLGLYREMADQAENTAKRLRERFDPERNGEVRIDQTLVAKELCTLLRFYTDRGVRYGLIEPETAASYQAFLTDLDAGYRLEVEKTGVLFHRQSSGIHRDEDQHHSSRSIDSGTTWPAASSPVWDFHLRPSRLQTFRQRPHRHR